MTAAVYDRWGVQVFEGDNLDVLREMPDCSIDSIVTDPPAGVRFMNRAWDSDMGGRHQWVDWLAERMAEAFRVLKPGGHALVWALPRTSHWTAWALEDAGFEIRDGLQHIFGSGFPKSLDVSKALDNAMGVEREVTAIGSDGVKRKPRAMAPGGGESQAVQTVSGPATGAVSEWNGWGTALKPAAETWWLCRKPFPGTVAGNVLEHGTGALNIDGCRVHTPGSEGRTKDGRWPSNVVLTHSADCGERCAEDCPVAELDRQGSGTRSEKPGARGRQASKNHTAAYGDFRGDVETPRYSDSGRTSRFFPVFRWEEKAPPAERPRVNGKSHPTVKPLDLMRWMVRLITPPGGTVLDLFAGTGTTGQAARAERMRAVLIEQDAESIEFIRARLDARPKTEAPQPDQPAEAVVDLLDLLDGEAS